MQQEAVHFVGEDERFVWHVVRAEGPGEVDRFAEGHVAVVVPMDEQDRRFPVFDVRHWRRLEGPLTGGLFLRRRIVPGNVLPNGGPVVDAVEIHAGREQIGGPSEAEGPECSV